MNYQALARKWRPRTFADVTGQEHVVGALSHSLRDQKLHHAYLFTGTRGVGKTTLARLLAKALNCERGVSAEPCGACAACTEIDAGRFPDLLEIDAASHTGIDNMREVLEGAQYAPTSGRFKVYLIDEVHMLSRAAFNSMLKTLEEPPGHVKFVLATTDPQKVPVTVLSRCLQLGLRNIPRAAIRDRLAFILREEGLDAETAALELIARAARGSLRDGLSLLDQALAHGDGRVAAAGVGAMLGLGGEQPLLAVLEALADRSADALLAAADAVAAGGCSLDTALQDLGGLLHQVALAQFQPAAVAPDRPERERLLALAARLDPAAVQLYYQIAVNGRRDLDWAPDEYAGFGMTMLRMLALGDAAASPSAAATPDPRLTEVSAAIHSPVSPARPPTPDAQGPSAIPRARPPEPTLTVVPAATQTSPDTALPGTGTPRVGMSGTGTPRAGTPGANEPAVNHAAHAVPNFDGDWPRLAERLELKGLIRVLAQYSELQDWAPGRIRFSVPPSHKHLLDKGFQQRLGDALSEHFGSPWKAEWAVAEGRGRSPAALDKQRKDEHYARAVESIEQDPFVRELIEKCDAVVTAIQPSSQRSEHDQ